VVAFPSLLRQDETILGYCLQRGNGSQRLSDKLDFANSYSALEQEFLVRGGKCSARCPADAEYVAMHATAESLKVGKSETSDRASLTRSDQDTRRRQDQGGVTPQFS